MSSWALALTQPRKEFAVSGALRGAALPHHLFKLRTQSVRRGRTVQRVAPAYPRYVFVRIASAATWARVREMKGVTGFIRNRNDYAPWRVPYRQIRALRAVSTDDFINYTPHAKFNLGDRVLVIGESSLIVGHSGVYQHPTLPGRSCILMEWLGRYVPIDVDDRDLEQFQPRLERGRRRHRGRRGRRGRLQRSHSAHLHLS